MAILFSEYFNIRKSEADDWFDPIVGRDTKLFIDPFLIQKHENTIPEFNGVHAKVISFFNAQFRSAAELIDREGTGKGAILRALHFPEAQELHLGYSRIGNPGAGSSKGHAKELLAATFELIDSGVGSVQRFEELSLFKEGFGADRIGDMVACLIKPALVLYTNRVCSELKIPVERQRLRHFDFEDGAWEDRVVDIPIVQTGRVRRGVVLVPQKFLRRLPTVGVEDFWDYCYSHENDVIRQRFGKDIKKNIGREDIFKIARQNADLRNAYLKSLDDREAESYDLERDPDLYHQWYTLGKRYAFNERLTLFAATNKEQFFKTTEAIINRFKHYIEDRGGWRVLRDDNGRGRKEEVVQRLFDGIVSAHCEKNDIDYSPEVDAGRGPVDFKFSSGYHKKTILEVKLARNGKLLHGLDTQLPIYMKAERITKGYLIVIRYVDEDLDKINLLRSNIGAISHKHGIELKMVVIDASKRPSASKA